MRQSKIQVAVGVLLLSASLLGGCTPRCQEICNKVLDCSLETTRVAKDECVLSCRLEEALYDDWEDDSKTAAFKEHKRCIGSSTCEEIASGTCYDEALFVLEPQSAL